MDGWRRRSPTRRGATCAPNGRQSHRSAASPAVPDLPSRTSPDGVHMPCVFTCSPSCARPSGGPRNRSTLPFAGSNGRRLVRSVGARLGGPPVRRGQAKMCPQGRVGRLGWHGRPSVGPSNRGTTVRNRVLLLLLALPLASFAAIASAPETLPAYLTLPPTLHPANSQSVTFEDYGEAEFDTHASEQPLLLKGKYWHANLVLDKAPQTDDTRVLWAAIKPALVQGGWTVADEYTSEGIVR